MNKKNILKAILIISILITCLSAFILFWDIVSSYCHETVFGLKSVSGVTVTGDSVRECGWDVFSREIARNVYRITHLIVFAVSGTSTIIVWRKIAENGKK